MMVKQLFTDHPDSVGETYLEHMRVALGFAGPLALAAGAALVHAFLPFLCVSTASSTVKRLHARMVARAPRPVQVRRREPLLGWDPVI